MNAVLEAGQLLGADRAAGVELAGGNADLGAETELAAIGELRRGIVQDDRRIDFFQEALRRRAVLGEDAIGMMRAIGLDMGDRAVEPVDQPAGQDRVEIFGAPVRFRRFADTRIDRHGRAVAPHRAAGIDQRPDQRREMGRRAGLVDQHLSSGSV